MINTKSNIEFEQVVERDCGIDIHKNILVTNHPWFRFKRRDSLF